VPEANLARASDSPTNEDGYVSKTSRGLLAAGLTVAVVGALGAAWTLNAGAEQITGEDAQPAVATEATEGAAEAVGGAVRAAGDAAVTPPTVLPWGARPARVRKGPPGATSSALRAAGLVAADADTSGSDLPRGRYGPKGRNGRHPLRTELTKIVPPQPPPVALAAEGTSKVSYLYNVGSQAAETDGFYASVTVGKPALARSDFHTLAEMALQSADGQQVIEVGWTVDRLVNGDDDPHLFVFHWVNGVPACYNGCGFQQYSRNIKPGDTLTYGAAKKFGIQYSDGAWWIAFDSEWIGYFPESLWKNRGVSFSRSGYLQVFGEVAAASSRPCTQMGNGQGGDQAAGLSSVTFLNGPSVTMGIRSTTDVYPVMQLSGRSFRYGGPGAC
jgi:Neprosin